MCYNDAGLALFTHNMDRNMDVDKKTHKRQYRTKKIGDKIPGTWFFFKKKKPFAYTHGIVITSNSHIFILSFG